MILIVGSYFGTKYYFNQEENSYWKNWNSTLQEKKSIVISLHEIGHVVMHLKISEYKNEALKAIFKYELKNVTIIPNKKKGYLGLTAGLIYCTSTIKKCPTGKSFLPFFSVEILKQHLYAALAGNKVTEIFLKGKNTTNLYHYNDFLNYQNPQKNSDIYKAKKIAKMIAQKTNKSVREILETAYQNVEKFLETEKTKILLLSQILLKKKKMTKTEIDTVIKNLNSPQKLSNFNLNKQTWDWKIFDSYKENKLEFWKIFSLSVIFGSSFLVLIVVLITLFKAKK